MAWEEPPPYPVGAGRHFFDCDTPPERGSLYVQRVPRGPVEVGGTLTLVEQRINPDRSAWAGLGLVDNEGRFLVGIALSEAGPDDPRVSARIDFLTETGDYEREWLSEEVGTGVAVPVSITYSGEGEAVLQVGATPPIAVQFHGVPGGFRLICHSSWARFDLEKP